MNKKLYFLIILLTAVLALSPAFICNSCIKEQEELKANKTVSIDEEREVTWVTVEDGSSGEPEDVEDLSEAVQGATKLEGHVYSPAKGILYLFLDQNNILDGEVIEMGWYEDIAFEIKESEGSEDHHHGEQIIRCLIYFNGSIWGKVDQDNQIIADLCGNKSIKYAIKAGTRGTIDSALTEIVKGLYKTKPDSFTIKGTYYRGEVPRAEGFLLPDNYQWDAVSYSSYD